MNVLPKEPEIVAQIQTDQSVCIRGLTRSFAVDNFWQSRISQMKAGG